MTDRTIALILVLGVALSWGGCDGGDRGVGDDPALPPTGLVAVQVVPATQVSPSSALAEIADVAVSISGPEMVPMEVSLPWDADDGEARGQIRVPQGIDRQFVVEALDGDSNPLFRGEVTADVEAGTTTSVRVHLWPLSAGVELEIGIENPARGLGTLWGICYGPFRSGQSPHTGVYPSEAEVAEDMALLAGRVERIRLYSSTQIHREIPRLAADEGLQCWAQAWIDTDAVTNEDEIAALIAIGQEDGAEVLIVGSEVLLRGDMSPAELIALIEHVRSETPDIPVTYNDTVQQLIDNPDVVAACDLVLANSYPYWEAVPAQRAVGHVAGEYERISAAYPDRRIVIGETGWPSGGPDHGRAVPDPVNQRRFLTGIVEWTRSEGVELLYFSYADEQWKVRDEGAVGAHWGLFNADRTMKSEIRRVWY